MQQSKKRPKLFGPRVPEQVHVSSPTKNLDFGGLASSRFWILRGGIPSPRSLCAVLGRGDTVASPHRAPISQFELFELILLLKLDGQFHVEQFESTVSQSTVPSPPLMYKSVAGLLYGFVLRTVSGMAMGRGVLMGVVGTISIHNP